MCGHSPLHHVINDYRTEPVQAGMRHVQAQAATRPCPSCGAPVQDDFVFCPRCGVEILTACPSCHRAVQTDWTNCAYCGTDLLAAKTQASTHSHS
ncbi:MAG: zinc ribbon domain-containing protein [Chloroflexi bacterium]|nr:zinc ribbon domain-containing protein [Chloroflexota bacterium]